MTSHHLVDLAIEPRVPLAERQRQVVAIMGDDALDPAVPSFRAVLVNEVGRLFDRVVLPALLPAWPGLPDDPFVAKCRGGFELYCALGLSTMITSTARPRIIDLASSVLRRSRASEAVMVSAARIAIPFVFRFLDVERCERVALGAAWILVLDEALDEGLADRGLDDQAAVMRGVLRGFAPTTSPPPVHAAAALTRAVRARCSDDADVAAFNAAEIKAGSSRLPSLSRYSLMCCLT